MQLDLPKTHVIPRPPVKSLVALTAENAGAIAAELADFHQPASFADGVLSYNHPYGAQQASVGDWLELYYIEGLDKYSVASQISIANQLAYQQVSSAFVSYTTQ